MEKEILVIGSVVRDIVILKNKKKSFFGGTGANISYGLGILGLKPTLFSVAGSDFHLDFSKHLNKNGVFLKVFVDKKEETAVYSITKNEKDGEIKNELWQPNVFNKIESLALTSLFSSLELKKIKIAIFSPGTPKSTLKHLKEFHKHKDKNVLVIFDPGQMTNFYSKKQFEECIKLSNILILNELEFKQAEKILKKKILNLFKNKILIKTCGRKGSIIYQKGKKINIPIVKPKKIESAVGAGDAYRAGLIFGLWKGMSLEESCKLGARLASKNVEFLGCQKYKI